MLNLLFRERAVKPAPPTDESAPPRARRRHAWRPWLRAIHRDVGHFVIGPTVIYALSGLAVNHIADWDPSFKDIHRIHHVHTPLPSGDRAAAASVLAALGMRAKPQDVYASADHELDIVFAKKTLHVDTRSGRVVEEGQEPRPLLRVANWLHLNRGKRAWTYVADTYAVFLLYLAISGLFMMPGRKGLLGRGGLFALLGIAVPVLYVVLSGGP
jgi:uncharacterized protein